MKGENGGRQRRLKTRNIPYSLVIVLGIDIEESRHRMYKILLLSTQLNPQ